MKEIIKKIFIIVLFIWFFVSILVLSLADFTSYTDQKKIENFNYYKNSSNHYENLYYDCLAQAGEKI